MGIKTEVLLSKMSRLIFNAENPKKMMTNRGAKDNSIEENELTYKRGELNKMDSIDSLIEEFKATGRTATRYPRKKMISISGGRSMPEAEAIASMERVIGKKITKELLIDKMHSIITKMEEIKAPDKQTKKGTTIFLAGSIDMGSAEDWQKKLVGELKDYNVTLYNPRRDDWDTSWKQEIENDKFREQVEWELRGQENADIIALYFDKDSKAPITFMELGLFADTGKMIVCVPEGFYRKGNVDIVCKRYGIKKVETWAEFIKAIIAKLPKEKIEKSGGKKRIRDIKDILNPPRDLEHGAAKRLLDKHPGLNAKLPNESKIEKQHIPQPRGGHHTYTPRETRKYECIVDGKKFWTIEELQEHKQKQHTQKELDAAMGKKRAEVERQEKVKTGLKRMIKQVGPLQKIRIDNILAHIKQLEGSGQFPSSLNYLKDKSKLESMTDKQLDDLRSELGRRIFLRKSKIGKTALLKQGNDFLNKSETSSIISQFIDGYKQVAILGPRLSASSIRNTFKLAKAVNIKKEFKLDLRGDDRLDWVLSIDSVAHNLHKEKTSDGSSVYKILDDIAGISKELGEEQRGDRLLVLKGEKDLSKYSELTILQKGYGLEQGKSFWNMFVNAVKNGVDALSDDEVILLREWIYARI